MASTIPVSSDAHRHAMESAQPRSALLPTSSTAPYLSLHTCFGTRENPVNTIRITSDDQAIDFNAAKDIADATAAALLGDTTCLSWFDREQNREAPAHVSECHDDTCENPGYIDYALSREAQLKIDVGGGAFVFCYRAVAEFLEQG